MYSFPHWIKRIAVRALSRRTYSYSKIISFTRQALCRKMKATKFWSNRKNLGLSFFCFTLPFALLRFYSQSWKYRTQSFIFHTRTSAFMKGFFLAFFSTHFFFFLFFFSVLLQRNSSYRDIIKGWIRTGCYSLKKIKLRRCQTSVCTLLSRNNRRSNWRLSFIRHALVMGSVTRVSGNYYRFMFNLLFHQKVKNCKF